MTVVLSMGLLLVRAGPAAAAACTVPGDYPTIQAAVTNPTCNPIMVAPGTYPENVVIGRALTLNGPNAGTSGAGARGPEATVFSFNITASSVIADGFSFTNPVVPGVEMNIFSAATVLSGIIVRNNIFSGYQSVGFPTFNAGNLLATRNLFKLPRPNTEAMQIKAGTGGGCSGTTVSNNVFRAATNNGGAEINFSCTASNSTNVTVVGNIDTGLAGDGPSFTAFAGVAGGVVIKNNYVIGAPTSGSAVFFFGGVTGSVDINSNIIRNFDGDGIDVGFDPAGFGISTGTFTFAHNDLSHNRRSIRLRTTATLDAFAGASVTFHQNDLSGNTLHIGAQNDSPSLVADGTCNWWGSASGPLAADNPSGTGDAVVGGITYRPWLTHRPPSHCGPPPPPKCKPGEHDDGEGDVEEHDNNGHHRGHFKFKECDGDEEFSHQDSDRNVDFHSDSSTASAPTFDALLPMATTTGQGWNNGEPVSYTLVVTDLGIGPGTDLYSLTLSDSSGVIYTIAGTLTAGNINVSH